MDCSDPDCLRTISPPPFVGLVCYGNGDFARLFWLAQVLALKNAAANGLYQGTAVVVPNRVEKRVGL